MGEIRKARLRWRFRKAVAVVVEGEQVRGRMKM